MADKLDQLSYYNLLKVPQDATADAVKQAFHKFAMKYHPDRFAGSPEKKRARASEVYRRGAEAYRILCDPVRRKAYDKGLVEGLLRFDPHLKREEPAAAPGKGKLKVKAPMARPFAQKAERFYKTADWGKAKLNLKMALSHDKENEQLQAWLADVELKLNPPAEEPQ